MKPTAAANAYKTEIGDKEDVDEYAEWVDSIEVDPHDGSLEHEGLQYGGINLPIHIREWGVVRYTSCSVRCKLSELEQGERG